MKIFKPTFNKGTQINLTVRIIMMLIRLVKNQNDTKLLAGMLYRKLSDFVVEM